MFDVQIARSRGEERTEDVLGSIAAYYRQVTTAARPMNRLVAAVMLATLAAIVVQVAGAYRPRWVGWVALVLAGGAILIAGIRTVPRAVRLGTRADPRGQQQRLARSIYRDHLMCASAISALLVVELGFG
jgi:hypothetical protein